MYLGREVAVERLGDILAGHIAYARLHYTMHWAQAMEYSPMSTTLLARSMLTGIEKYATLY